MGKLVAAYDLGLNALMVRYAMRYSSRFPADPEAANGVNNCLIDDLILLADDLPQDAVRDLTQMASELRGLLSVGRLGPHGVHAAMPDDCGNPRITELRRNLVLMSMGALSGSALLPWYRLGRAMALCYLNLLNQERSQVLPSLPGVIRCARRLSEDQIGGAKILNRLAGLRPERAAKDAITILNAVLRKKKNILDTSMPKVAVISKVAQLDRKLSGEIERLPDIQVLKILLDDPSRPSAELNGINFPISAHQASILHEVVRARGKVVSSSKMLKRQLNLERANIGREVDRLPAPIKKLIQRQKGPQGGFRWIG
jgi:hypothetical protein